MSRRAGRALALLALAAGAAALALWPRPERGESPRLAAGADVLACRENLRAIHAGLAAYVGRYGTLPSGSGTGFLAALVTGGIWPDTPESRARLQCPGGGDYAVRDFAAHPLVRFPCGGDEPIAGCANARGRNHAGATNVLYADKTVRTLLVATEIEKGTLPAGATTLPVGPASPLADLKKLR
ncbi:MAG: hypothetical protein AB1726_08955 [Planctomycetota bacterium]